MSFVTSDKTASEIVADVVAARADNGIRMRTNTLPSSPSPKRNTVTHTVTAADEIAAEVEVKAPSVYLRKIYNARVSVKDSTGAEKTGDLVSNIDGMAVLVENGAVSELLEDDVITVEFEGD
jgi:hypothetical protein